MLVKNFPTRIHMRRVSVIPRLKENLKALDKARVHAESEMSKYKDTRNDKVKEAFALKKEYIEKQIEILEKKTFGIDIESLRSIRTKKSRVKK